MNSPDQREALLAGEIDGALGYPFGHLADGLAQITITHYPVSLAWPYMDMDAPRSLAEAVRYPFIGFPRATYPAYYDELKDAVDEAVAGIDVTQTATTEPAILSLVAAGVGIALVNGANRYRAPRGVTFHELSDIRLKLPLSFLYRPSPVSPALARFMSVLE